VAAAAAKATFYVRLHRAQNQARGRSVGKIIYARCEHSSDFITADIANSVAMHANIHGAFDECKFVLVGNSGQ
jgi:hypothetical protein